MPTTPNLQTIIDAIRAEFDPRAAAGEFGDAKIIGIGVCNCRNKRGSSSPSHHAWCNAGDVRISRRTIATANERRLGNAISSFLTVHRDRLNVYRILWWSRSTFTGNTVAGHLNHLHIVPWPYGIGTPPCMGGTLEVRNRDGTIGTTFGGGTEAPPDDQDGDEEVKVQELTALIQSSLIDAGADLGDFEGYTAEDGTQYPDGADGIIRLRSGVSYPALVQAMRSLGFALDHLVTDQELDAHAEDHTAHDEGHH